MITTNDTKKALIAKLLEDKHITIDDAFMLLDEKEHVSYPVYPSWPGDGWWGIYPPAQPFYYGDTFRITCGSPGTLTNITTDGPLVTDTVHYTPEQWNQMHRSGQISYTAN